MFPASVFTVGLVGAIMTWVVSVIVWLLGYPVSSNFVAVFVFFILLSFLGLLMLGFERLLK